jgi:hypothetical protein
MAGVAQPLAPVVTHAFVASVLAEDATVIAAAETAVSAEIAGRPIQEGGSFLSEFNDDLTFAVVDDHGQQSDLEFGPDGKFSERAIASLATRTGATLAQNELVTELTYTVTDETGQRSDLEVGLDGKLTPRVIDAIADRIGLGSQSGILDWIIGSGDSLTMGTGGTPYTTQLMTIEPDWNVINMGVGGETSTTIAGRMGGRPMLVTVAGSRIPTSGGVTVTLSSDDGEAPPLPLLQNAGAGGVNPVRIAGVEGTLSVSGTGPYTYTFTRSLPGSAVTTNGFFPLITQAMRDYRSGIHVLWWGINDGATDASHIIARIRALTEWLTDPVPRYLVVGTSGGIGRATINQQLLQEFGRRYINVLAYLLSDAAFTESDITKTAQDIIDIGNTTVPTSFRFDSTHFNDIGYWLLAKLVRDRILEMEWK